MSRGTHVLFPAPPAYPPPPALNVRNSTRSKGTEVIVIVGASLVAKG